MDRIEELAALEAKIPALERVVRALGTCTRPSHRQQMARAVRQKGLPRSAAERYEAELQRLLEMKNRVRQLLGKEPLPT